MKHLPENVYHLQQLLWFGNSSFCRQRFAIHSNPCTLSVDITASAGDSRGVHEVDDVSDDVVDELDASHLKQPLHVPVLVRKVVDLLDPQPGQVRAVESAAGTGACSRIRSRDRCVLLNLQPGQTGAYCRIGSRDKNFQINSGPRCVLLMCRCLLKSVRVVRVTSHADWCLLKYSWPRAGVYRPNVYCRHVQMFVHMFVSSPCAGVF